MRTYYYTQTVVYTLAVQATTQEEADAIAFDTDVLAGGVNANYEGWQEDGVEA
jgi:hypothetical protein